MMADEAVIREPRLRIEQPRQTLDERVERSRSEARFCGGAGQPLAEPDLLADPGRHQSSRTTSDPAGSSATTLSPIPKAGAPEPAFNA